MPFRQTHGVAFKTLTPHTLLEVNVVRFNANGDEEAVPAYDAYNHHYALTMKGANASKDDSVEKILPLGDSGPSVLLSSAGLGDSLLDSQWFSEGNGNEHRLSFHGYPQGFAQVRAQQPSA